MGLTLPNPRSVFLPSLPPSDLDDKVFRDYVKELTSVIEESFIKNFDNIDYILSTGTSGSFVASNGDTITVTNGIITGLS